MLLSRLRTFSPRFTGWTGAVHGFDEISHRRCSRSCPYCQRRCIKRFCQATTYSPSFLTWVEHLIRYQLSQANSSSCVQVTTDVTKQRLEADKWTRDCFLSRFGKEWPLDYLVTECTATILGGVIDPSNVFQYGIFRLCEDKAMQQRICDEISTVWPRGSSEIPDTRVLKELPLLVS